MDKFKHIKFNDDEEEIVEVKAGVRFDTPDGEMFWMIPEGVSISDTDHYIPLSVEKITNDRYFEKALEMKGPAAQVAYEFIYRYNRLYTDVNRRISFLTDNSWYPITEFTVTNIKTRERHQAMLRISNHKPSDIGWSQDPQKKNMMCVTLLIGKEPEELPYKVLDSYKRIDLRIPNLKTFMANEELCEFIRDIAKGIGNTISGTYTFGNWQFSKHRKRVSMKNKLITGFLPSELRALKPIKQRNDSNTANYDAGLYVVPGTGEAVTVFFDKAWKPRRAFYLKNKYLGDRKSNKVDITVLAESRQSINEAMQCAPVFNMDTQEYMINGMADTLGYEIGLAMCYDVIEQLDLSFVNRVLEICSKKLPAGSEPFIYDYMKYSTDISAYIEENDRDNIIRDWLSELGRNQMNMFLKCLDIDESGKIKVMKLIKVEQMVSGTWDVCWQQWRYDLLAKPQKGDILIEGKVDLSYVDWPNSIRLFSNNNVPDCYFLYLNTYDPVVVPESITINGVVNAI